MKGLNEKLDELIEEFSFNGLIRELKKVDNLGYYLSDKELLDTIRHRNNRTQEKIVTDIIKDGNIDFEGIYKTLEKSSDYILSELSSDYVKRNIIPDVVEDYGNELFDELILSDNLGAFIETVIEKCRTNQLKL